MSGNAKMTFYKKLFSKAKKVKSIFAVKRWLLRSEFFSLKKGLINDFVLQVYPRTFNLAIVALILSVIKYPFEYELAERKNILNFI